MDLDRLEELAKTATPGPWFRSPEQGVRLDGWSTVRGRDDNRPIARIRSVDREELWPNPDEQTGLDAEYVAAASPQTVLQLVAIAKAAKEYQGGMFRPGSSDLTEAWTALCAALAGVE